MTEAVESGTKNRIRRPSPPDLRMEDLPHVLEGLEVHEIKDGLIVYQASHDRVHYLNATAGIVFALCDGTQSSRAIARHVATAYQLDDPPLEEVEQCLAHLRDEGLVR